MEIIFNNQSENPLVSFILLDWSCRESIHFLHYINNQTIPRDQYEVIWIEYYSKKLPAIELELNKNNKEKTHPIVDQWIVMDMPKTLYYHKHLMYNIGIVLSKGEIVTICDSDAMVKPGFVKTIIQSFEENSNILLHMDEVRNNSKDYYPFNYPDFKKVEGNGAINYKDGTTTGILDEVDPLHTRNYGACLCARREDLIAIGGSDEHLDYLGHICGPYEMTFRLLNMERREIWHPTELLYHVWHPGQAGDGNYVGPHDGRHMSTTAFDVLSSARIQPLVKNAAIRLLQAEGKASDSDLVKQLINSSYFGDWTHEAMDQSNQFNRWHTPEFLRSYKQYNICKYGEVFYGVPQFLGEFDIQLDHQRNLPQILSAENLNQLHNQIDNIQGFGYSQYKYPLVRKLVGETGYQFLKSIKSKIPSIAKSPLIPYKGYNLITWGNQFYAAPHSLGELNLNEKHWRSHPEILTGPDMKALKRQVDARLEEITCYRYPALKKFIGKSAYRTLRKIRDFFRSKSKNGT